MRLGSNCATIGMGAWPPVAAPPAPAAAACCFCSIVAPPVGCSGGGFCDVTSCFIALTPFFKLLPGAVRPVALPATPADAVASLLPSVFVLLLLPTAELAAPVPLLLFCCCCCEAAAAAAAFLALALAACNGVAERDQVRTSVITMG